MVQIHSPRPFFKLKHQIERFSLWGRKVYAVCLAVEKNIDLSSWPRALGLQRQISHRCV